MLLQMPLGIIYFTVFVTLIAASLWLIVRPILELALGIPACSSSAITDTYTPGWLMPSAVIGGVLLLTATMHLVKYTGRLHGAMPKPCWCGNRIS